MRRTMWASAPGTGKGAIRVGVWVRQGFTPRRRAGGRYLAAARRFALACLPFAGASIAFAGVDLRLETDTSQAGVDSIVEVRLVAKSTTANAEAISGLDAIVTWDAGSLKLLGAEAKNAPLWLLAGLFNDALADGLNNTYDDGNAYFQALSQFTTPAMATPAGLSVARFRFRALSPSAGAEIRVVRSLGGVTRSRVFQFGAVNTDILSVLGSLSVKVLQTASMSSSDVSLVAGRRAEAWVYGSLEGGMTFGTTVMMQITASDGALGTLRFTAAPPVDVVQMEDPWPGFGTFTAFDTNAAGTGPTLNGSVDDNGAFVPVLLNYHAALSAFPLQASAEAEGEWELRLATATGESHWEGIATALHTGVVRIVELGDGDGDSAVDLRDWSEMQNCFTGVEVTGPTPSYSREPRQRCGVYDFDDDGDVDGIDFASFESVLIGVEP